MTVSKEGLADLLALRYSSRGLGTEARVSTLIDHVRLTERVSPFLEAPPPRAFRRLEARSSAGRGLAVLRFTGSHGKAMGRLEIGNRAVVARLQSTAYSVQANSNGVSRSPALFAPVRCLPAGWELGRDPKAQPPGPRGTSVMGETPQRDIYVSYRCVNAFLENPVAP